MKRTRKPDHFSQAQPPMDPRILGSRTVRRVLLLLLGITIARSVRICPRPRITATPRSHFRSRAEDFRP